ncbi:MAG: hypothetical protein QUS11_11435 [Candidatus Fermentibacter sp.]|nr:hypothetical protein [Candidatus Fermentibacter sp.]
MITATLVALAAPAAPQWAAAQAPPAWEVVEGTGGYMSACALGDGFLCLTWGGGAVWLVRPGEDASVLASTETDGVERLSEPSPGGGLAGFVISDPRGDSVCIVDSTGNVVSGWAGGSAGRPAWTADGRPFSTVDGFLAEGGSAAAVESDAYAIAPSPGGSMAAWADGDTLVTALVSDCSDVSVSSIALTASPIRTVWIDGSSPIVLLVDGTMRRVSLEEGTTEVFASGDGLAWNFGLGAGLVTDSRDDGHMLLGSDSYLVMRGGSIRKVASPPGTAPMSPEPAPWGFTAVDGLTGAVLLLRL